MASLVNIAFTFHAKCFCMLTLVCKIAWLMLSLHDNNRSFPPYSWLSIGNIVDLHAGFAILATNCVSIGNITWVLALFQICMSLGNNSNTLHEHWQYYCGHFCRYFCSRWNIKCDENGTPLGCGLSENPPPGKMSTIWCQTEISCKIKDDLHELRELCWVTKEF